MLSIPEAVIQRTQATLFSFLYKHKKDKLKRQVHFQPLSKGGLNFPCFRTVVKALRLSWIGRKKPGRQSPTTISTNLVAKFGGQSSILNCNHSAKKLISSIPTFYRAFKIVDLEDPMQSDFVLWNSKKITIENKSLFWRSWLHQKVVFTQDILDGNRNFLLSTSLSTRD